MGAEDRSSRGAIAAAAAPSPLAAAPVAARAAVAAVAPSPAASSAAGPDRGHRPDQAAAPAQIDGDVDSGGGPVEMGARDARQLRDGDADAVFCEPIGGLFKSLAYQ